MHHPVHGHNSGNGHSLPQLRPHLPGTSRSYADTTSPLAHLNNKHITFSFKLVYVSLHFTLLPTSLLFLIRLWPCDPISPTSTLPSPPPLVMPHTPRGDDEVLRLQGYHREPPGGARSIYCRIDYFLGPPPTYLCMNCQASANITPEQTIHPADSSYTHSQILTFVCFPARQTQLEWWYFKASPLTHAL